VSRVAGREGDSFQSPGAQRDAIGHFAKARGWRLVDVAEEFDVSGGRMDRPKLRRLIDRVHQGEVEGIVVAKLDRFARNLSGGLAAIKEVHDAGGFVVAVDGGVDTSDASANGAMGQLQLGLLLLLAEWERSTLAEGIEASKGRAVDRGVHISAFVPYGYVRRDARREGQERDARLEPHPERAVVVGEAFRARAAGRSLSDVVDMLNERVPGGPGGEGNWTAPTVSRMLKNPVYTGQARQGKHVREAAHQPLVSVELFETVQRMRVPADRRAGETSLLAGLCRCAGCRFAVTRTRSRGVHVLRCRRRYALGDCTEPVEAAAHLVEPVVVGRFFEAIGPGGILARPADAQAELEVLRAAVERADKELEGFLSAVSVVDVGAALYRQGIEARQAAVEAARSVLEAAGTTAPGIPDLVDLRDAWDEMTVPERREILSAGIEAVFVAKDDGRPIADRVTLLWRGHQPDLVAALPRRGKVTEPRPLAAAA
jgi:DNA invertase Pin-like site-specific DNA recombinase